MASTSRIGTADVSAMDCRRSVQVKPMRVVGNTIAHNSGVDVHPLTKNIVAYAAGRCVVLLNVDTNQQSIVTLPHMQSAGDANARVSCVTFSKCGQYFAAGESGAKNASIWVWRYDTLQLVGQCKGHRLGVACITFLSCSSTSHLTSCGVVHDGQVAVWDWKSFQSTPEGRDTAKVPSVSPSWSGKTSSRILSVHETQDQAFVTLGVKHVKFWKIPAGQSRRKRRSSAAVPSPRMERSKGLEGRAPVLGAQRNLTFVDAHSMDGGRIVAVTDCGTVCVFSSKHQIEKAVPLKDKRAFSVCEGLQGRTFTVACGDGFVRHVDELNLSVRSSFPRPMGHGCFGDQDHAHNAHPDAIACRPLGSDRMLVVYADRSNSIAVFTINATEAVLQTMQPAHPCALSDITPFSGSSSQTVHVATACLDGHVRFWDLSATEVHLRGLVSGMEGDKEMAKVPGFEKDGSGGTLAERATTSANGVRSLAVSSDQRSLVTGDRGGNLRVFELKDVDGQDVIETTQKMFVEAHDGDILSLSFNQQNTLLASASRDRLIHVFSCEPDSVGVMDLVTTLDDHSSSVTGLCFVDNNDVGESFLVSGSADKSIIVRKCSRKDGATTVQRSHTNMISRGVSGMCLSHTQGEPRILACTKSNSIVSLLAQKGENMSALKCPEKLGSIVSSRNGSLFAASSASKQVQVFDAATRTQLLCGVGHADQISAMAFGPSDSCVVTVGADGLMCLWPIGPTGEEEARQSDAVLAAEPCSAVDDEVLLDDFGFGGDDDDDDDLTFAAAGGWGTHAAGQWAKGSEADQEGAWASSFGFGDDGDERRLTIEPPSPFGSERAQKHPQAKSSFRMSTEDDGDMFSSFRTVGDSVARRMSLSRAFRGGVKGETGSDASNESNAVTQVTASSDESSPKIAFDGAEESITSESASFQTTASHDESSAGSEVRAGKESHENIDTSTEEGEKMESTHLIEENALAGEAKADVAGTRRDDGDHPCQESVQSSEVVQSSSPEAKESPRDGRQSIGATLNEDDGAEEEVEVIPATKADVLGAQDSRQRVLPDEQEERIQSFHSRRAALRERAVAARRQRSEMPPCTCAVAHCSGEHPEGGENEQPSGIAAASKAELLRKTFDECVAQRNDETAAGTIEPVMEYILRELGNTAAQKSNAKEQAVVDPKEAANAISQLQQAMALLGRIATSSTE